MTGQEAYEIYANESNDPHAGGWPAIKSTRVGKGFEGIAKAMTSKPPVPRMIHEAFWETYYQWADGLEKVLKSEQVNDLNIIARLAEEYQDACKRLDIVAANYAIAPGPDCAWIVVAKHAAIPARK